MHKKQKPIKKIDLHKKSRSTFESNDLTFKEKVYFIFCVHLLLLKNIFDTINFPIF